MEELRQLLLESYKKYPLMEKEDFLKLIYQNEMGGGHMIEDESLSLDFLKKEASSVESKERPCDYIGNNIARVYLSDVLFREIPLKWLNSAFVITANSHKGDMSSLINKIGVFYSMVKEGELPFPLEEIEEFLASYRDKNFPPIHHSKIYHESYKPAYRIIYSSLADSVPILQRANELKKEKERVVIVMDGRCASGKTTLSGYLKDILSCPVIHMDDFFLPSSMRTPARLSEAGGNIHYEYFKEAVLEPLRRSGDIVFRPYSCSLQGFTDEIKVPKSDFLIIEGSYSLHPYFEDMGDIKVFSDINKEEQKKRLIKRNGAFAENFFSKWIPMEERYFDLMDIRHKADFILNQGEQNENSL